MSHDAALARVRAERREALRYSDSHIRRCGNCGAWNVIGRLCPTCHIFWHQWASTKHT